MAETKVAEKERRKRQVKWVGEATEYGSRGDKLLHFNDEEGVNYTIFSKGLFTHIKEGEELDFDVELRITTKDEKKYENWVVTQIYKDGKPVMEKTAPRRDGGGYRGKSPEELELSRRSFAMSYAKDTEVALIGAGIKKEVDIKRMLAHAQEIYEWLGGTKIMVEQIQSIIKGKANVKTKVKASNEPSSDEEVSTDETGQAIPGEDLEQSDVVSFIPKTKGDLFTLCLKRYDLVPTQVEKKLAEIYEKDDYSRKDITNIGEAWQKIQEVMKGEK